MHSLFMQLKISNWQHSVFYVSKAEHAKLNVILLNLDLDILRLNFVSFQCARGKSFIERKPEVHPKCFNCIFFFFFKNVTLQILYFVLVS